MNCLVKENATANHGLQAPDDLDHRHNKQRVVLTQQAIQIIDPKNAQARPARQQQHKLGAHDIPKLLRQHQQRGLGQKHRVDAENTRGARMAQPHPRDHDVRHVVGAARLGNLRLDPEPQRVEADDDDENDDDIYPERDPHEELLRLIQGQLLEPVMVRGRHRRDVAARDEHHRERVILEGQRLPEQHRRKHRVTNQRHARQRRQQTLRGKPEPGDVARAAQRIEEVPRDPQHAGLVVARLAVEARLAERRGVGARVGGRDDVREADEVHAEPAERISGHGAQQPDDPRHDAERPDVDGARPFRGADPLGDMPLHDFHRLRDIRKLQR
eukprot:CAMPEP_0174890936 /NCGR_PEP_ID=MMETSP0167-20121228/6035_1 /TAXON_ID=38298 /ORGANISM="Rhodella maculata, Strain CCMP736" /LENGTH=327 /DNA_ID=CAMNT_0016128913 /DNA_START=261 /DNA_END=1242 /DNA_ORIENTATION=-